MDESPASRLNDATEETPFADLTPDRVLDTLQDIGFRGDGRLLQLNSYENRVFQVGLEDGGMVVAKFYRHGRWTSEQILEEHTFARELVNAEVPVVDPLELHGSHAMSVLGTPPTLGCQGTVRVSVTPRKGGRGPELENPEVLTWIGRFLARLHQVGSQSVFRYRPTLSVTHTGRAARQWLLDHPVIPLDQLPPWQRASEQVLDLAQQAFDRVEGLTLRRLHGDCHIGNILWTEQGPHFVDLDDACMGPAVQDFWMLLSGDIEQRQSQLYALLDGYESITEFDWRELKLIEALRALRMIHHSAWLARRWHDPAFPAAFPWFEGGTYWQQQTDLLRQQIELLQDQLDQPMWP
ncbi:MAG TPA: serine/threonine protein kinase [Aquabacterium sp.]|nr:serine/threonine protein kinase [Aquabacterium sp.]